MVRTEGIYDETLQPSTDLTDYCAKCLTTETRKLTKTATVDIVEDVSDLVSEVVTNVEAHVTQCLRENGIEHTLLITTLVL